MKLYEFTITDDKNFSEDEMFNSAWRTADEEAKQQGWDCRYVVTLVGFPEVLSDGSKKYYFEVYSIGEEN